MPRAAKLFVVPKPESPIWVEVDSLFARIKELVGEAAVSAAPFSLAPPKPKVPKKPRRRRKPPVSLSDEQLQALLATAKKHRHRDWLMILVAYVHGLRASEVTNLTAANFKDGEIRVQRGKGSDETTHPLLHHQNPLLNEKAAIEDWLANRSNYGVKGGAREARKCSTLTREKTLPCTRSVKSLPNRQIGQIVDSEENSGVDPLYGDAVKLVIAAGKVSTSVLQRGLRIAYGRACHLIDLMEESGLVGPPPKGPGARKLLPAARRKAAEAELRNLPSATIPQPPPATPKRRGDPKERLFPITRVRFWQLVHGYALEAGIPSRKAKTHTLKHSTATHLVQSGKALNDIQEYMGWASIETMNWYTRANEEEVGQRMGDAFRQRPGLRVFRQGSLFDGE